MPGLLDLPSEILLMIFEQVLVDNDLEHVEEEVEIRRDSPDGPDEILSNTGEVTNAWLLDDDPRDRGYSQVEVLGTCWYTWVACGLSFATP